MLDSGRVVKLSGEPTSLWGRKHAETEPQRPAMSVADASDANDGGAAPAPAGAPASGPAHKTLLLVDGTRLRRECLAHLLGSVLPDFEIVAVASTRPPQALRAAPPDIVLFNAPPAGGPLIDEIEEIAAAAYGSPLLLLSESEGAFDAGAAAELGVAGLFPPTYGASLLVAAIQLALAGGRIHMPVPPRVVSQSRLGRGATG